MPIFGEQPRAERQQPGRRRQTVAERARGVRARVLPEGPRVLPEEEPIPLAADFDAPEDQDERRRASGGRASGGRASVVEEHAQQPAPVRSAFAMDDDPPAEVEAAPVATGETPAD